MRPPLDESRFNSFTHYAGSKKQNVSFSLIKVLQVSIFPFVQDVPVSLSFRKAFSLDTSQWGGKAATIMLLLLCYSFLYNYIYIHVYTRTSFFSSSIHIKFFFTLAILVEYSALCQCACSPPAGSCVGPEAGASGHGT